MLFLRQSAISRGWRSISKPRVISAAPY